MAELFDVVALLEDIPPEKLERGDVGTIVEIFSSDTNRPQGFLVEFADEKGVTFAMPVLHEKQFMRLRYRRAA